MWQDWIGKKVFIKLISDDVYNATVIEVDVDEKFMRILDKYNETVIVSISQILKIVDETEGNYFKDNTERR